MKIKMLNGALVFVYLIALVTGCSTPGYESTEVALMSASIGKNAPGTNPTYNERVQEILTLQKNYDANQKAFEKQADKLTGKASFLGMTHVGVGWAGLGSAIAATALTVASPANAVLSVIFTGIAGGSAGFLGSLDQEGFSKAAIAQGMIPALQLDAYAVTNFTTATLIDLAAQNAVTADFTMEKKQQDAYVSSIKVATLMLKNNYVLSTTQTGSMTPSLVADFTPNPIIGSHPLTVNFTDHSSAGVTKFYWDFGDGKNSGMCTDKTPSNTYINAGKYTVTLTVFGADGITGQKSQTITVN